MPKILAHLVTDIPVELVAIAAVDGDLAVGAVQPRPGLILFAFPDNHVLVDVPLLRSDHDSVHQRCSQPQRNESKTQHKPQVSQVHRT